MSRFFSKARKSLFPGTQTSQYLKYALGEIILVVMGILIALQVDNWNDDRNFRRSLSSSLRQLQQDLQNDQLLFQQMDSINKVFLLNAARVKELVRKNTEMADIHEIRQLDLGSFNLDYNKSVYESMVNSGLLYKGDSEGLVEAITHYYRQLEDRDRVFDSTTEALINSRFTDAYLPFDYLTNADEINLDEQKNSLEWLNQPISLEYKASMRYLLLYLDISRTKKAALEQLQSENSRLQELIADFLQ